MFTRSIIVFALALFTSFASPGQLSLGASESETIDVIREIFTLTAAHEAECSSLVRDETNVRFMGVLCASFEGSFEEFRSRLQLDRDDVVARTAWEVSGALHERIFSIDQTVIGVRFQAGEVLVVYTRGPRT